MSLDAKVTLVKLVFLRLGKILQEYIVIEKIKYILLKVK